MARKHQFGLRLKSLRKAKGLTQEKLAELIDRSVDAISNIERGLSLPGYDTLLRISEKMSVPVDVVCGWLDEREQSVDEERVALESQLAAIVKKLSTTYLRAAVEQISVLSNLDRAN